jgi:hypothetical protein
VAPQPRTAREIATALREEIPQPRSNLKPVGSWRGLKPDQHLHRIGEDPPRVWVVSRVNRGGATVQTADGAIGLLTDPDWKRAWKKVRKPRKATPTPTKE